MQVVATVKHGAQLTGRPPVEGERIDQAALEYSMEEIDASVVQQAARIAADTDGEVTAVTIAPFDAVETLRYALARGADRAIRVWDPEFEDFEVMTPRMKASILDAAVDPLSPDLVLTGIESDDDAFGTTGPMLAVSLGYGWVGSVVDLSADVAAGEITIRRELEGRWTERRAIGLPAVATLHAGIEPLEYISRSALYQHTTVDRIHELTGADLAIDPDSLRPDFHRTTIERPTRNATELDGSPRDQARELARVFEKEVP